MGTPEFAVPSLDILLKSNYDICAVVTAPDKKKGRGLKFVFSDVKNFALDKNLKILQPEKLKDDIFIEEIKTLNPDLIIVVAFRILPSEVYKIPAKGSFNLHASLLPEFRGAAPVNRAIMEGKKQTGVTTFFLQDKVDTGNIILQKKILIEDKDNAGTLHDKLSAAGALCVLETVRLIESGNFNPQIQDDSLASPAPKIFKEDCLINWNQSAEKIHNLIRGLSPYPGAFTYFENKNIKIFKSEITEINSNASPGKISTANKKLLVSTSDFDIEIIEIQSEGKRKVSGSDFANSLKNISGNSELYFKSVQEIKNL